MVISGMENGNPGNRRFDLLIGDKVNGFPLLTTQIMGKICCQIQTKESRLKVTNILILSIEFMWNGCQILN